MRQTNFDGEQDKLFRQRLAKLRELPTPPKKKERTFLQCVRENEAELNGLFDRGFSVAQVADGLSGDGLDVTPARLRSALLKLKRERGEMPEPKKQRRRRRTKRNTPAGDSIAPVEVKTHTNESKTDETQVPVPDTPVQKSVSAVAAGGSGDGAPAVPMTADSSSFAAKKFTGKI
jgi:hypothetical protein